MFKISPLRKRQFFGAIIGLILGVFLVLVVYNIYLKYVVSVGKKALNIYASSVSSLLSVSQIYWDELTEEKQIKLNRQFMAEWEEERKKIK